MPTDGFVEKGLSNIVYMYQEKDESASIHQ